MALAIAAALADFTASRWAEVAAQTIILEWGWIVAAILAAVVFLQLIALAWRRVLGVLGGRASVLDTTWAWSRTSLARYLPTPVWVVGSRAHAVVKFGATWQVGAYSVAMELWGAVVASAALALLALPLWTDLSPLASMLACMATVLVLAPLTYRLLGALLPSLRAVRRTKLPELLAWSSLYAAAFGAYGLAHLLVLRGLSVPLPEPLTLMGISALAWLVGTINVLSPGGLGTRELVLVHALEGQVGAGDALALTIISRLTVTAAEMLLFVTTYVLVRRAESSQRVPAGQHVR